MVSHLSDSDRCETQVSIYSLRRAGIVGGKLRWDSAMDIAEAEAHAGGREGKANGDEERHDKDATEET